MADYKKSLYHLAINGQGYMLRGAPKSPSRRMSQAPLLGIEPSEVDLEYKDSSSFLPWVQTDWSGGFQEEKWEDTATFKSGVDLEYISAYGQLCLLNDKAAVATIGTNYTFGAAKEFNNTLVIGTKHASLATLHYLDTSDSKTDVTTGWTAIHQVNDMDELHGFLWLGLSRTGGAENVLQTWSGSALANKSLAGTALASSTAIRVVKRIEGRLYVAGYTGTAADGDALIYTDDDGSTYTTLITKTGLNRTIIQGVDNLGTLYFLIQDGFRTELWWINNTMVTQIYIWDNLTSPKIGAWLGNVFVSGKEDGELKIFKWNGAQLMTTFEESVSGMNWNSSRFIVWDNNLYCYGLVFDGQFWFPSYRFKYSSNEIWPFAVWGSTTSQVPYFQGLDSTSLKITKLNTAAYITSNGTMTTGIFTAKKPSVTKLWFSVALSFEKLVASQTIQVEYSIDDEVTWTSIGTVTYASTGSGADTEQTLYFPNNTTSKKIQLRITLDSSSSNTPTLYDFNCRYLLLGDGRYQWGLQLVCQDDMMLLDGKTYEEKRASELRSLLHTLKFKNQIVAFQDVDYEETAINDADGITTTDATITVDSTSGFPEQGRLKIEQEEILYTGKTAVAFTGCTRGARGTLKATHADNIAVSNAYNVLITNVAEVNPTGAKTQVEEAFVRVSLLET